MTLNTGILSNQKNPNLWHDTYWKFLSLTDAQAAIDLYDSYPQRNLKLVYQMRTPITGYTP